VDILLEADYDVSLETILRNEDFLTTRSMDFKLKLINPCRYTNMHANTTMPNL